MKTSNDILDAVAEKLGGVNDHTIAKLTGITPSAISLVRTGRRSIAPRDCKKAAAVLGVEVGSLVAIATAEREEDKSIRDSLLRLAGVGLKTAASARNRRKAAAALVLLTAGAVAGAPPPASAQAATAGDRLCVLCKVTRRVRWRRSKRRRLGYPKRSKRMIAGVFFNGFSRRREVLPMHGTRFLGIVTRAA